MSKNNDLIEQIGILETLKSKYDSAIERCTKLEDEVINHISFLLKQ